MSFIIALFIGTILALVESGVILISVFLVIVVATCVDVVPSSVMSQSITLITVIPFSISSSLIHFFDLDLKCLNCIGKVSEGQ